MTTLDKLLDEVRAIAAREGRPVEAVLGDMLREYQPAEANGDAHEATKPATIEGAEPVAPDPLDAITGIVDDEVGDGPEATTGDFLLEMAAAAEALGHHGPGDLVDRSREILSIDWPDYLLKRLRDQDSDDDSDR